MDGIKLSFQPGALRATVADAVKRQTGARSLRSILERAMLEIMYEAPALPDLEEIVITEDVIHRTGKPKLKHKTRRNRKSA
jgi:ATP-dependent Clp protease ATP-binding subunit ClpX